MIKYQKNNEIQKFKMYEKRYEKYLEKTYDIQFSDSAN